MTKKIKTNFIPDCSGKTKKGSILLIAVAIVVIAAAFGAGWVWSKFGTSPLAPPPRGGEVVEQPADEVVADESTLEPTIVDDPNVLTIDWFEADEQKVRNSDYVWNDVVFYNQELYPEDGIGPKALALGIVNGGIYNGYELQIYFGGISGMGVSYEIFYLLVPPIESENSLVVLDLYASSFFRLPQPQSTASDILHEDRLAQLGQHPRIILDKGSKISELEEKNTVTDIEGRVYNLIGVGLRLDYPTEIELPDPTTAVSFNDGSKLNLYIGETAFSYNKNTFYYIRQDGRIVWYDLDVSFMDDDNVPKITWNDGSKNSQNFTKGIVGGCGMGAMTNIIDITKIGEIKESGITVSNQKIYEPISYDTEYFKGFFETWKINNDLETIEQFTASHPFFYYQDSLDRWVEFQNGEILLNMAECGKPVIYLYPEKTTNLDVQLYPQGGFTYTEPVYNNGWRVTASPDGKLINRDDGQVYPYLFWEGRGGLYVSPNRYWVVKQSNVHDFLISTLARLGLNTKETADFLEFWEPRMQDFAYYKIGFYGTNIMNQLAPLSISENPDTLIRILMDYEPLDTPIKSNPPVLQATPVRSGFTVVEWGGVLR